MLLLFRWNGDIRMTPQADLLLNNVMRTKQDKFLDQLGAYTLIDIGIIDAVNADGRAQVSTCRFSGGRQVVYNNVEIVYPGNTGGAYMSACAGTSCLIFIPYSCMPDTTAQKMRVGASVYSKDGIKVMPISNGQSLKVSTMFDTGGDWYVGNDIWKLQFAEYFISLSQGDTLSVSKDIDGAFHFYYKGKNSGAFTIDVTDEGIVKKYDASDGSVKWTSSMNTSGVVSFSQVDSSDNVLSSLQIASDGAMTINVGKATLSIDRDGKISVDSSHTDGVSISSPHKISITSNDDIAITAGTGKQVKINGTNLTVD